MYSMLATLTPTKRNPVSLIEKFYDPLGLLSPVIIKLLIQKLHQYKSDWDQVISEDVAQEWKSTITDLAIPVSTSLPRCYLCETTDHLEALALCGFCDASTRAYAAIICLILRSKTHSSILVCGGQDNYVVSF